MKANIIKDVPLKSGRVVSSGTPCTVEHHLWDRALITPLNEEPFTMKYVYLHRYVSGFLAFNHDSLRDEELLERGVSFTPKGLTVEIDGRDIYGFPSIHRILLAI